MSDISMPKLGLRERKKIKTKAAIQQHAIRLIREQGYQATTVEQIAEAAEISPSTFFRYFPTKEAVVLDDDYDPLLIEAFRSQSPELKPLPAIRKAIRQAMVHISDEEKAALWERVQLIMSVPELRAASVQQVANTAGMVAELAAERTGRDAGSLEVRTFAAAFVSTVIASQMHYSANPGADFFELLDQALALMEAGFPL